VKIGRDLATRKFVCAAVWLAHQPGDGRAACLALLTLPFLQADGPSPPTCPSCLLALRPVGWLMRWAFWAYGRALAAGELSLVLPLINALTAVPAVQVAGASSGERPTLRLQCRVAPACAGALLAGTRDGRWLQLGS